MGKRSDTQGDWWVMVAGVAAVALCCGGPLLIGALLVAGIGGWLLSKEFLFAGALVLAFAAAIGAAWYRRRFRAY